MSIREGLVEIKDRFSLEVNDAVMDRLAAGIRDCYVANGLDPTDRSALEGTLMGLWIAMFQAPGTTWAEAEVVRRWLDGELPVVSIEDMLHLPGV